MYYKPFWALIALVALVFWWLMRRYFSWSTQIPFFYNKEIPLSGNYRDYDPLILPMSGDIVLFFHADWCVTCREAEKNFLTSWVPEWLTILKVDFDTDTKLRKKYMVLSQTSFVLIQPDGTLVKRWLWWRTIQDILAKIQETKQLKTDLNDIKKPTWISATAYFAWWCFRCLEWPFESLNGVSEVINGYIGWDERSAYYGIVSLGVTKHREAVKVIYDPELVTYKDLLDTYRRQIDPTDAGGQFADRWNHYKTAIYYANDKEKKAILESKENLIVSAKFSKPIVVDIFPITPFYPAEEYHQDYYKNNTEYYNSYKKWSWRKDFIENNRKEK